MDEVITFGDIEAALVTYLADLLDIAVSATVPTTRPTEFVIVRRLGGPRRDLVTDSPLVTFECWAKNGADALALVQSVRAEVNALKGETIDGLKIYRVKEAAGPGMLPDPDSNQMRYVFTSTIDVRAIPVLPELS